MKRIGPLPRAKRSSPREWYYVIIVLLIACLVTCARWDQEKFVTYEIEIPYERSPVVKPVYPPPHRSDPLRNWWGTMEEPIVWPE